jgi:hypothetical protein
MRYSVNNFRSRDLEIGRSNDGSPSRFCGDVGGKNEADS